MALIDNYSYINQMIKYNYIKVFYFSRVFIKSRIEDAATTHRENLLFARYRNFCNLHQQVRPILFFLFSFSLRIFTKIILARVCTPYYFLSIELYRRTAYWNILIVQTIPRGKLLKHFRYYRLSDGTEFSAESARQYSAQKLAGTMGTALSRLSGNFPPDRYRRWRLRRESK